MSRRVVLATQNEHKVHELRQILADVCRDLDLEIVSATAFPEVPDVTETEVTFAGNARLKAEALAAATGLPALADASGLAASRATMPDADTHIILPEIISKEPLGPVVRHGDNQWGDVVRRAGGRGA